MTGFTIDPTPGLPTRPELPGDLDPAIRKWILWLEGAGKQVHDCWAGAGEFNPDDSDDYEVDDAAMAVAMFQLEELIRQVP